MAGPALIQGHMQAFRPPGIADSYLLLPLPPVLIVLQADFYFPLNLFFLRSVQFFLCVNALQLRLHGNRPGMLFVPKRAGEIAPVNGEHHHRHIHEFCQLTHIFGDICGSTRVGMPGFGEYRHDLPVFMQGIGDVFYHLDIGDISSFSDTANPSVQPFPKSGKAFHIGYIIGPVGKQGQRGDIIVGKTLMGGQHQVGWPEVLHVYLFNFESVTSGHQPGASPDEGKQKRILLHGFFLHSKRGHVFFRITQHICLRSAVSEKGSRPRTVFRIRSSSVSSDSIAQNPVCANRRGRKSKPYYSLSTVHILHSTEKMIQECKQEYYRILSWNRE